eukprot:5673911-Amphidinium_carterae.1
MENNTSNSPLTLSTAPHFSRQHPHYSICHPPKMQRKPVHNLSMHPTNLYATISTKQLSQSPETHNRSDLQPILLLVHALSND